LRAAFVTSSSDAQPNCICARFVIPVALIQAVHDHLVAVAFVALVTAARVVHLAALVCARGAFNRT
jgi:hypothetical protein